nr:MoaD/ThiS family protein [Geomicrobium sediminis]
MRRHFNLLATNVMIEHNGVALTADQQGQIQLESGDKIEIVRFVGGG